MDLFFTILGYVAATGTTVAFVPQLISVVKTRDTKSISLGMYIIFVIGILSWIIYGVYKKDLPLLIANSISIVLASIILVYKVINVVNGVDKKQKMNLENKDSK